MTDNSNDQTSGRSPARRPVGRPQKWTDPEELQKAIDDYFNKCDELGQPYLITGLTLHLGFCDRSSLFRYAEKDDEIATLIKAAKCRVEGQREYELLTRQGSVTGQIFHLKANSKWSDKQEIEVNNPDGNLGTKVLTVLPQQPKSMEEWVKWYNEVQGSRDDPEAIDVTPGVEPSGWELP